MLKSLKPFQPLNDISEKIEVFGQVSALAANLLSLEFALHDFNHSVVDPLPEGRWKTWGRADELWKMTCFEVFFGRRGETGYWEVNLSPSRQLWNIYRFTEYRQPQPPRADEGFSLEDMRIESGTLRAQLRSSEPLGLLKLGLSAVVRTSGRIHYFALGHGEKPDFHSPQNWLTTLQVPLP